MLIGLVIYCLDVDWFSGRLVVGCVDLLGLVVWFVRFGLLV